MTLMRGVFSLLLAGVCASANLCRADPLVITTSTGVVKGAEQSSVLTWSNIPFAESTGGNNRWRPPIPKLAWSGIRDATQWQFPATACPQAGANPFLYTSTEDCLVLHIVAPKNITTPVPSMVWIHGGSLRTGSGFLYDPTSIVAENNVIGVTINYRLGVLGFMGLPEFASEEGGSFGNFGFLDQQLALKWINENIAAFGGDPDKITIFGESAGGTSVSAHIAAPSSQGLFSAAIIESGQSDFAWSPQQSYEVAQHQIAQHSAKECANLQGASLTSCLRALPLSTILGTAISSKLNFALTIDSKTILGPAASLISNGMHSPLPILQGTNMDEMTVFLCPAFPDYQDLTLNEFQVYLSGQETNKTLANLAIDNYDFTSDVWDRAVELETDCVFKCPAKKMIEASVNSLNKNPDSFMYSFEYVPGFVSACEQVGHSMEIPFLFPSIISKYSPGYNFPENELELGFEMRKLWAAFARTHKATTDKMDFPHYCANAPGESGDFSKCPHSYVSIIDPSDGLTRLNKAFRDSECTFWLENAAELANSTVVDPTTPTLSYSIHDRISQIAFA